MFCSKCGIKLEEGAKFCPECGATVENQKSGNTIEGVSGVYVDNTTPPVENVVTKTNGVNNKSIRNIIIGVVIVAVIGFFGYKFLLGGSSSSYEAPIETLVTGIEDKDIDAIFSVIPDEIFEKYEEEYGIDIKQLTSLLSSSLEEQMFAEFEGMTLSYEIENVEDCSSVQVEEIIDANKSYYDIDLDITAAKNLDVTLTATSNDDTESNSVTLTVIEIDGSWYIDPTAMNIF